MVNRRINRRHLWCCVILVSGLVFHLSGCGIKAPPRPPAYDELPQVSQLDAELENGQVVLSWHCRSRMNQEIKGFGIYRYRLSLNREPCDGCPLTFEKIGDLPVQNPAAAGTRTYRFLLTPDTGFHYRFKVAAYVGGGAQGPFSESIRIDVP